MKTYLFIPLAALLLAAGCQKDDPNAGLPAATQTGANTAGCLINGQLFVASGFGSGPGKVAGIGGGFAYDSAYYLRLNGKLGGQDGSLHIYLRSIPSYKTNSLIRTYLLNEQSAYMPASSPTQCRNYGAFFPNDNSGEAYITNNIHVGKVDFTYANLVDLSRPITAGTFEFTAVSNRDPTKTLRVTSGRFDRQQ
ncbi:MAG: hypothetical protein M3Y12_10480 [Bacteroidota bacterium]|nr:hypothetical protein [Bacteroidota bacterium]